LLTSDDIAVYEAVIAGYARVGRILMLPPAPGPPPGSAAAGHEIEKKTAQPVVRMRPYTAAGGELTLEADRWWTLDGRRAGPITVPQAAVNDFKTRNSVRVSLKAFRPRELRIEWSNRQWAMNCLYSLTRPGYSPSRDEAIVELSCGAAGFGGGGQLLYLRRVGGKWRVVAQQQTSIS